MRYLYIGEIAELLGVSKDTIRIYEEQGLIFPVRDETASGATRRRIWTG